MTRDHTVIEELLAIRSLGGLDGDDVGLLERELASHGDCEECRRLASEYDETAGRLAFALEPAPVDMAQADEILRRATHPATQEVAPPPVAAPVDELEERRGRRGRSWPALVAAAVAVLVVGVGRRALRAGPFDRGAGIDGSDRWSASPATRGNSPWRIGPGSQARCWWVRGSPTRVRTRSTRSGCCRGRRP